MAMTPGSVSIDGAGTASGSGYAKEVYDVLEAGTDFQGIIPPALVTAKRQLADLANACASLISHVVTNSTVTTVDDGSGGAVPWAGTGSGGTVA
ncbi:MAG: hypothetical protein E2O75_04990 [Chloroflexi bacterium]|nr:MAG: hypothetical protein E2O75_04990 [Chloroflexota bacterium]